MKLTNQELERRGKACDGYDNKAKPDLTTSRNQGKGKSNRDGYVCWDVGLRNTFSVSIIF